MVAMSLSKVFSNSQGFQADDLTSTTKDDNTWVAHNFPTPVETKFKQEDISSIEQETNHKGTQAKTEKEPQKAKPKAVPQKSKTQKDSEPISKAKEAGDKKVESKPPTPRPKTAKKKEPENKPPPPIPAGYLSPEAVKKVEELAYQNGLKEGKIQGEKQSAEEAFNKGLDEGIAKGATEATEDSYNKGKEDGIKSIKEEFETATNSLLTICKEIELFREQITSEYSTKVQTFALDITEKLINLSIRNNNQVILSTLETALAKALKSSEVTIFLNPEDLATVEEHREELISGIAGLENIILKKDVLLDKGGAKIESDQCVIDASISSQLELIYQELGLNNEK